MSAEVLVLFEERDLVSGMQRVRGHQSGHTAADDGDAAGAGGRGRASHQGMLTETARAGAGRASIVDFVCRQLVHQKLMALDGGSLELIDAWGARTFPRPSAKDSPARVFVRDPRAYRAIVSGGSLGAADAYSDAWWDADDLTEVIGVMARSQDAIGRLDGWTTCAARAAHVAEFRLRRNRRPQSRRNISAHYDLGNDFFRAFLDPTMTYSCAVFPDAASSLEEASRHKIDLICRRLQLGPGDELLEIGSGWGSLALHAATRYKCRVVTTTISREQFAHVRRIVDQAGLADRVTVLDADYRDLPAALGRRFDKVVSVEMIEAVGYDYLDAYLQTCQRLTKPGGALLVQAIVIADARYESYRHSVDFIQRYIFPGGFLPSVADLRRRLAARTDFREARLDDITAHYPRTLRHWRRRLDENEPALLAMGHPERLLRLWRYYFSYSEAGFLAGTIGDVQMLLHRGGGERA